MAQRFSDTGIFTRRRFWEHTGSHWERGSDRGGRRELESVGDHPHSFLVSRTLARCAAWSTHAACFSAA